MTEMNITIRREEETDHRVVEEITREAFWNLNVPGCEEHYLVHCLRKHPDFIRELDYVAEIEGKVVGSIMYTKSFVVDEDQNKIETITFGPLSVLPEYQRKGIGTALINYTKEIALRDKLNAIIIFGHPHNYCKHGFKNSIDFNISNGEGNFPYGQLVLELEKGIFEGKKWKFYYSSVYELDASEVEIFDDQFPRKNKEYRASQEEFSIAVRAFLE
ncbi:MAG: N-acetyltransferase [Halobacteriota archaeon]|nr:N-acetyltransferase [Halobacteriota archaeon]